MKNETYHYTFLPSLDIAEVEATATLALLATESLHGESRVRLESNLAFDAKSRSCFIESVNEVGRDLNQLFLGFITREFGPDSFRVKRVDEPTAAPAG